MISKERLLAAVEHGRVAFDSDGNPVDPPEIDVGFPATAQVAPVTDAVKRLRGDVVESLDRDSLWTVEIMVLEREVLESLDPEEMTAGEVWLAVIRAGYTWQISPSSSP